MGIEVHQIHNLVRTYQRSLQPAVSARPVEPADRQNDRVSVSAEARERHETESAIPEPARNNKKRTR